MKIYLDNNLGVTNVEQEELTQDTYGYNILKVYIPNAVLTPYDTFTCYYGALLQNGRKVGWFAMEARTSSDADYEENYTLYKATLEQCVVSVEGKVYIGCQVLLGNSGNATLIKKNTAVVQFNVRKSVAINNDILVLDPDQTNTDVLESYKQLLENALLTYATKATTYTKTEVDGKLDLKADKSDTYTKAEVDSATLNLAGQIAGARVELNNRINTTNNILVETNAKVASLETDVDTLQNNTYSKTEVDGKLDLKADKSTTYTKTEVNNITNDLSARITANADDIDTLEGNVTTLQDDVAALKSVQNVVEVVATYSALQSYDTTKLDVDDKVQVIADESQGGASTIYNWNGSTWQYVGAFGSNSYTKAETYNKTQIDSALSDKADKSNTYTRAVIDSMILTLSTDKADKSNTYTKTEIDNTMQEVGQMFEIVGNEVLKKADKTELNNAINDLRWELGSHTLDVVSDTTTAYSKSVPSGAIGCQINKVGGMSYKCLNLANTSLFEIGAINLSTGGDDSRTDRMRSNYIEVNPNTQYTLKWDGNDVNYVLYNENKEKISNSIGGTFTTTTTTKYIRFYSGLFTTSTQIMLNDGSTALPYEPYFEGIRDSAVTSVVSKDSNDTTIDTLSIPTAIQNLTGYGWGINSTCYNYIDFANKKFVQKVGCVVLNGTESGWEDRPNYTYADRFVLNASGFLSPSEKGIVNWAGFEYIVTAPTTYHYVSNYNGHIMVNFSAKGTTALAQFKEYLGTNNLIVYFELATPIETDISAYLTTDTIDVEPNGTLEFTNTYNNDVPSDIDYLIEEVKA